MRELHPVYRSYPGYAREDLESAIRAGRARLRGLPTVREGDVMTIGPVTANHRLDLIQNRLIERRPRPMGWQTSFWDVEIEWTGISNYLLAFAVKRWSKVKAADADTKKKRVTISQRDMVIAKKLTQGVQPGRDPDWPWKKFCDIIRDEASGWIGHSPRRPKRGFSDKQITRSTQTLIEDN
jgi:hypothetical protein